MYKKIFIAAALLVAGVLSVNAATEWGIEYEKTTRTEAKVVDLLCEITGNCVPECGAGKRQLGLLFDDGKLVPAVKNFEPFAGATNDLIKYCNKRIVADGLMISNPKMPMFVIQFSRLAPDGKWSRANQFGKDWSKANGGKPSNQWFREDPRIKALIKERGVFGIPGLKPEN
ncbi:hypothetical protein MNBD_ALPHA08-99 [hydrothermal vent metagenome]|uniref:Uncharacterized protein n=1 Tax=hydrothermal vent metagenome TaxID=652676 RepID=A0A3B0RHP2_9ZZZZ